MMVHLDTIQEKFKGQGHGSEVQGHRTKNISSLKGESETGNINQGAGGMYLKSRCELNYK